jgi:hypothetical protein
MLLPVFASKIDPNFLEPQAQKNAKKAAYPFLEFHFGF